MSGLDPWDRQPKETSKAYEAFCIYRDMGAKRTTRSTAEALAKSETLIKTWSSKYGWVKRAAAWDSAPGKALVEAYADQARRIAEQHDRVATKLLDRLEQNLERLPEGHDPSIKWSTAHGAARQGHTLATELVKPESGAKEQITQAIADLIASLSEE